MFYSKNNINSKAWLDIIFAGRNKEYGAYQLRRYSSKATNLALLAVLSAVGGLCSLSFIASNESPMVNNSAVIEEDIYEVMLDTDELVKIEPLREEDNATESPAQVAQDVSAVDLLKFTEINPSTNPSNEEVASVEETMDKKIMLASLTMKGQKGGELVPKGTFGTSKREGGATGRAIGDPNGTSDKMEVFETVEVYPEPPGGMKAFVEWVAKNYKFSDNAVQNGANGLVQISFVVEKDGSLSSFVINRDIGFGTGDEAIRLLRKAKNWSPGIQNGIPVRVSFSLPIRLNTVIN